VVYLLVFFGNAKFIHIWVTTESEMRLCVFVYACMWVVCTNMCCVETGGRGPLHSSSGTNLSLVGNRLPCASWWVALCVVTGAKDRGWGLDWDAIRRREVNMKYDVCSISSDLGEDIGVAGASGSLADDLEEGW